MRGGLPWGCYESGQQLDAKTIGQWKNLFSIGKKRRGVFPRGPGKQSPPHCRMTFIASFLSSFRSARRKLPRSSGLPPSERYLRFPDFSRKNSATAPEPIQDESLRKIDEDFDSCSSLNWKGLFSLIGRFYQEFRKKSGTWRIRKSRQTCSCRPTKKHIDYYEHNFMMKESPSKAPSFHYAWLILLMAFMTVFASLGLARFGYSVLLPAMQEKLVEH